MAGSIHSSSKMGSLSASNLELLNRDGFVVISNLLSASELESLRAASQSIAEYARSGKWAHVRPVPKEFPPYNVNSRSNPAGEGIWGVQFLMHPNLPYHSLFTASYFHPRTLEIVKELLQCRDEDLVMELYNLLVRPDSDFELRWHRYSIPADATAEEEMTRLREPAWHAQWNLALYEDESLIVVPGSHVRPRTDIERKADPFEKTLPGQLVVKMNPGDAVFYNNNILHRGVYDSTRERMTLHGSMGHTKGSNLRARNVLQHGLREWVDEVDLSELPVEQRNRAELMRDRLIKMGKESGDVGYCLT